MEIYEYENYIIYENGDVLNVNSGKYIIPFIDDKGYKRLNLCKNGNQKLFRLHTLLALAYIPNPENKKEIDHINRDKLDNRLCNLRWSDRYEQNLNKCIYKTNTSGEKNVYYCKTYNNWKFKKTINNIKFYKSFKTKEEAIEFKKEYYEDNNLEYI